MASGLLAVLGLFVLFAVGILLIPKPKPPKKPDYIHEVYDLHRRD